MLRRDPGRPLSFAATPVFALMALMTAAFGSDGAGLLCGVTHDNSVFGGMVPMYLLMSMFHAAPWLKLIAGGNIPAMIRAAIGNHEPR